MKALILASVFIGAMSMTIGMFVISLPVGLIGAGLMLTTCGFLLLLTEDVE